MPKIKEVYEYNNGSWANGTPIGADASNVDVALSDSTSTKDLQSVLGNVSVSDPSMKTQLTGKVNASGGDIKDTVVSVLDPASETDTSEDIDGTDVVVAAGESQTTMWSKFNMFRKRVSNKFSNFLISSVEDVLEPSDTKTYSQAALNSYFADVIGYKTDADVATVGSVADQLSTLNNKLFPIGAIYISVVSTNPSTWFGGVWVQLKGRFLVGVGAIEANTTNFWGTVTPGSVSCPVNEMGGEAYHTLTTTEMPSHSHVVKWYGSGNNVSLNEGSGYGYYLSWAAGEGAGYLAGEAVGGSGQHNNMPPYIAVYMWKRTE